MGDLYTDLGIDKDATDKEIKHAYRKQARKHHPDIGGNWVTIKDINRAYLILSDPNSRAKYDRGEDPETEPTEVLAQKMLTQVFTIVLQKYLGEWGVDLISECKKALGLEIIEIETKIEKTKEIIDKLKIVLKRLSHNEKILEDKLGMLIETEIRRIEIEIKSEFETIKVLKYTLIIVDYYKFYTLQEY